MQKLKKIIIIFCCIISLTACVPTEIVAPHHDDPLEPLNREIFKFNLIIDKVIFRPVAIVYDTIVPGPVAHRVGDFFDNLDDLTNIANNTLQLKFYDAWSDVWRFAFNTTFGLLGLFDVATCAGLPKHHQDFGLTLAYWGVTRSAYLMIPFFGPTTIRDGIGWLVDWNYLSIWPFIDSDTLRYSLYAVRLVHKRSCLLPADKLIDESMDPYVFVRDAYTQRREAEINSLYKKDCLKVADAKKPGDSADTFVAEDGGSGDKDDTFVPENETNASSNVDKDDPFVAESTNVMQPKNKSSTKTDPNDTFVP